MVGGGPIRVTRIPLWETSPARCRGENRGNCREHLMLRKLACGLVVVALFAGFVLADEVKGKFKKWNKGTITLTVDGKDVEYKGNKEMKVVHGDEELKGKDRRKVFQDLKEGTEVTVTYDKDGDNITVKEIKIKK
jgi:hypothetical protein